MELRIPVGFCSIIGSITLFLILGTGEISALKHGHQISILLANAICNYTKIPQAVKLVLSPDFQRGVHVFSKGWEGESWGFLHKQARPDSNSRSRSHFNLITEDSEEKNRRVERATLKQEQTNGTKSKLVCYQGSCENCWEANSDYPECVTAYYKDQDTGFYAQGYFDGYCYPNAEYCDFCYTAKCNDPKHARCKGPHPPPANNFNCFWGNCESYVKVHSNLPQCMTAYFTGGARSFHPQNKKLGYCREYAEKCTACDKNECNDPSKSPACGTHPPPPPPTAPPPTAGPPTPKPPPPARRPCQKKELVLGLKSQVDFDVVNVKTHNGSLYALVLRPQLPWMQAMYACATHGMSLSDVRNTEELNFLNGFLSDYVDNLKPSVEIWIGGHRFRGGPGKRDATWFEGNQEIQKNAWNTGEGEDSHGKENCVMLENQVPPEFKATDTTCEKCLPFICKSLI